MREIFDILAAAAQARVQRVAEEGAKKIALVLAGAFILVCGFVALMVAAYFALAPIASRQGAALIIGAGFLVIGMIVLWLARPKKSSSRSGGGRQSGPKPESLDEEAVMTAKVLEKEAARLLTDHSKTAVLIALLAGTAVGASPELRKALARLLERRSRDS